MEVRLAFRSLRQRPGFAAAAIATLAVGIGASTAIFSVAYGVSLRPLPYPAAERLIRIYEANPANSQLRNDVSVAAFHEWRGGASSIETAALFNKSSTRFLATPDPQPVSTQSVSPTFFDVLGVKPILGPGFKPEREYTRYTADDEAMLSYGAWQRLFGGRRDVVGQTLEFTGAGDNDLYRIVGVMPAAFGFAEPVDLWRPTKLVELPLTRSNRSLRYDRVVARLRPDATIAQARAELETVAARMANEIPGIHGGWTVTVESLHDSIVGTFGRAMWLLLAAVGVVLLVACLNVGGLLVARAVARDRETAVRAALGAGSWRLLRLWAAESSVICALGGAFGFLVAWSGVAALKAAAPPGIPRLDAIAIDLPALVVAALSTLLAVAVLTLMSAGRARRGALADCLRGGSTTAGDNRVTSAALMLTQCAGAVTLVILGVMLTRSFIELTSVDLGWEAAGVLSLRAAPRFPPEVRRPWYRYVEWSDRLIARLEATPGVERAAITTQVPLSPQAFSSTLARGRGRTASDEARWPGVKHSVTDGYFALMEIRLLEGRFFGRDDRFSEALLVGTEKTERGVAIVSASTARALWPDRSALGQALWLPLIDNVGWREVVGVVEDIQFHGVGETPALHVFVPWTQGSSGNPRLLVKGARAAASLAPVVREVARAVDTGTQIEQVVAMDDLVSRATAQSRFTSRVVSAFGLVALVLAAVGIYGTLSYVVAARLRELGIRVALGAPRASIIITVLSRGLVPCAAGALLGVGIAAALARAFQSLLFGVEPLDTGSFVSGGMVLLAVAVGAALGPALRAARVDPARALWAE